MNHEPHHPAWPVSIPSVTPLEPGMRICICWGHGEETRGVYVSTYASQLAEVSGILFKDERTGETDSIPLCYIHHIEKVGE